MFGSYRLSIGGPMRERRKWPSTVPIRIFDKSGNQDRIQVRWEERPAVLILPRCTAPGALSGNPASFTPNYWIHIADPTFSNLPEELKKRDGSKIEIGRFRGVPFCRLLAKIAHGMVVVECGLSDEVEWPARAIVRGELDGLSEFIGGYVDDLPPDAGVPHWVIINTVEKNGKIYFTVRIRLYSYLGTPIYIVVAAIASDLKYKSNKTLSCEEFFDVKLLKPPLAP